MIYTSRERKRESFAFFHLLKLEKTRFHEVEREGIRKDVQDVQRERERERSKKKETNRNEDAIRRGFISNDR